jgi:hypothetical protein
MTDEEKSDLVSMLVSELNFVPQEEMSRRLTAVEIRRKELGDIEN